MSIRVIIHLKSLSLDASGADLRCREDDIAGELAALALEAGVTDEVNGDSADVVTAVKKKVLSPGHFYESKWLEVEQFPSWFWLMVIWLWFRLSFRTRLWFRNLGYGWNLGYGLGL